MFPTPNFSFLLLYQQKATHIVRGNNNVSLNMSYEWASLLKLS